MSSRMTGMQRLYWFSLQVAAWLRVGAGQPWRQRGWHQDIANTWLPRTIPKTIPKDGPHLTLAAPAGPTPFWVLLVSVGRVSSAALISRYYYVFHCIWGARGTMNTVMQRLYRLLQAYVKTRDRAIYVIQDYWNAAFVSFLVAYVTFWDYFMSSRITGMHRLYRFLQAYVTIWDDFRSSMITAMQRLYRFL